MFSERTPGRATVDGPELPLERSVAMPTNRFVLETDSGIRTTALRRPAAAAADARAAIAGAAALDNNGTGAPAPPGRQGARARRLDPDENEVPRPRPSRRG